MVKVITWNVNSIRKRIAQLCNVLEEYDVDVALLQEIKCESEQFPFSELESAGYTCCVNGQKARNGVAIVSRVPILKTESCSVFNESDDVFPQSSGSYSKQEARYIECTLDFCGKNVRVVSVYVPNGQEVGSDTFEYKLYFLERLKARLLYITKSIDLLMVGGDFNVAIEEIDVHDPKIMDGKLCFHMRERAKLREILNIGFIDAYRTFVGDSKKEFSWWNYREGAWQNNKGLRIDGFLITPRTTDEMEECKILSEVRGRESPSDHAPVLCEIGKKTQVTSKTKSG